MKVYNYLTQIYFRKKPQKVAVHEAGPSKLVRKKEKVAKIQHEVVEEGEVTKKKSKKHKLVEDVVEVLPEIKVKVIKLYDITF